MGTLKRLTLPYESSKKYHPSEHKLWHYWELKIKNYQSIRDYRELWGETQLEGGQSICYPGFAVKRAADREPPWGLFPLTFKLGPLIKIPQINPAQNAPIIFTNALLIKFNPFSGADVRNIRGPVKFYQSLPRRLQLTGHHTTITAGFQSDDVCPCVIVLSRIDTA